jgi:hypothetical protein
MRQTSGDLILRKDSRAGWSRLLLLLVPAAGLTARAYLTEGWEWALGTAVAGTSILLVAAWGVHRSRIMLTADEILVRGLVLRRHRARTHATKVVRARVLGPKNTSVDTLFVLDARDKVLLRIYGSGYRTRDLDRLVDALGLPESGPIDPVTVPELENEYPGLVSWAVKNQYEVGITAAGAVIVALAAVVFAL